MKIPRLRTVLLTPLALFALLYTALAIRHAVVDDSVAIQIESRVNHETIAIFGASGTAGDGILKAALADRDIKKVHVITRRATPRIEEGVASGKVQMTLHTDYLDYSEVREQIVEADAVYWAIGTSSVGVDEKTYGMIHVDFPTRFVAEWASVSDKPDISFHYISSSDISSNSRMMWAREKVRAERTLFEFAEGSSLRVIAYRPDYIGPTKEEAHIGQDLLYWFFAPVNSAVRATQIGQAMIEVTARGSQFENGDILGTGNIIRYSDTYEQRRISRYP
jgi:nucleoside-diphosphate-sugar epimerase